MKNIKLLIVFFIAANVSTAQRYDEWARQKKTQKKYLLEQIVALKTYIGYAAEGYSIVNKGLHTIKDIKHGDFKIHNDFFQTLSVVNPAVKKYSKVAAIISMQVSIARIIRTVHLKQLTAAELQYLQRVFSSVVDDCDNLLAELIALITDGEQQMKDDERIQRIDALYTAMQENKTFVQSFSNAAKKLCVQRGRELSGIQIITRLNGIK